MPTFRAIEAAAVTFDGVTYSLDPARTVSTDDPVWGPLIVAFPDRFGRFTEPVEQATAAPGERRNARRPRG